MSAIPSQLLRGFQDCPAVGLVPVVLHAGLLEEVTGEALGRAVLQADLAEVAILRLALKTNKLISSAVFKIVRNATTT